MTPQKNMRAGQRSYALKSTSIDINGTLFMLNDISSQGIGLILEEDSVEFFMGQRIESIPIPLEHGTRHVQGVVAHISKNAENSICGIRFLFKSKEEFESVAAFKSQRMLNTQ
jgi:hypothetical protein